VARALSADRLADRPGKGPNHRSPEAPHAPKGAGDVTGTVRTAGRGGNSLIATARQDIFCLHERLCWLDERIAGFERPIAAMRTPLLLAD
jgi:hypothetical protein